MTSSVNRSSVTGSEPPVRSGGINTGTGETGAGDAGSQAARELLSGVARALGGMEPDSALRALLASASPLDALLMRNTGIDHFRAPPDEARPAGDRSVHVVRGGETLSGIARRHGTSLQRLLAANPRLASHPDLIRPGDRVRVPGRSHGQDHAVRRGDAPTHAAGTATTGASGGASGAGHALRASGAVTTAGVSAAGLRFIFDHEAVPGTSNRLHWPGGGSGVTLGPGYDMKGASRADIVRDLAAIGVGHSAAVKASHGAGLTGSAARSFAAANRDVIDLSPVQERALLAHTIRGYAGEVRALVHVPVTQNQFDAMVSLAYNVGTGRKGFAGSTVLRRLNAGDSAGAADAFRRFNKSGGHVMRGLVNRRNDEVALFNTPGSALAGAGPRAGNGPRGADVVRPTTTGPATARTPAGYAAAIEVNGDKQARADLAAGRKVVVALRSDTNTTANGGHGRYDDMMAVVWKDGSGTVHLREFEGNTEPSSQYRYDGPKAARGSFTDMNGDKKYDLGRLRTGNYRYVQQDGRFAGNTFFRATRTQVVERDTNQDGRFDGGDRNRIDHSGARRAMLIHQGGRNNTWSAGCQTIRSADFDAFVRALGGQNSFSYVLMNAR